AGLPVGGGAYENSVAARRRRSPDAPTCALDRAELRRTLGYRAGPRPGTEGPRVDAGAGDVPGLADAALTSAPVRRDAHRIQSARQPEPSSHRSVRRAVAVARIHRTLGKRPPH